MSIIEFQGGMFVKGQREGFHHDVLQELHGRPNKAICHTVSYANMSDMVIGAMNGMLHGGNVPAFRELALVAIRAVVLVDPDSGDKEIEKRIRSECSIYLKLIEQAAAKNNIGEMLENGKKILQILNNFSENLRIGNEEWNRFAGERFDPNRWCYLDYDESDGSDCELLLISEETEIYNNPEIWQREHCGPGFYLLDELDCERLYILLHPDENAIQHWQPFYKPSINIGIYSGNRYKYYVVSSQNNYPCPDKDEDCEELNVRQVPIYYKHRSSFYPVY